MHDLVIRGGTIVDGSGGERFDGDVAITDGVISEIGTISGRGREEINALGKLVLPGWVDVHTHYDGQATWDPYLKPSGNHGITTMVMGNCGVGFAPAKPDQHDWLIDLMEGVEDIPGAALHEGITWGWETFPEYLDKLAEMPRAVDIATQVPHGPLRVYVMGERGAKQEVATADDLNAMSAIVEEAARAGALGFSTSRTMVHRSISGEVVPGTFAHTDELLGIGKALGRAGHGVFEIASDMTPAEDEIAWMRDLSMATGLPVGVALVQMDHQPDGWREILGAMERHNADGANIVAFVSARPTSQLLGLEGRFHPFSHHPTYLKIADLPLAERVAAMRQPEIRASIMAEETTMKSRFRRRMMLEFAKMFPINNPPDYEPGPEQSVASRAAADGLSPEDFAYDWLLREGGSGLLYFPILNYSHGDFGVIEEMIQAPNAVLSLSDGGAHCSYICDAGTPSYLLTHWARDRARGPRLPLEQLVHLQTMRTAACYGLHDRGALTPGRLGDVNIVDFDKLHLHAPTMVRDLPAGGHRLLQEVDGYEATIKRGQVTWREGEPTGLLPGTLIRGPQGR
jgi:N-acyl-D-amino-acid deacylase